MRLIPRASRREPEQNRSPNRAEEKHLRNKPLKAAGGEGGEGGGRGGKPEGRASAPARRTGREALTIPSLVPTPIPAPTVAPVIGLIAATIQAMRLSYTTAGATGKSKPFGSIGVQVYRSVGTVAATDPAQATFVGVVTKSPFRQTFNADDQGKICTFFCRFVTRSGPDGTAQTGPWSNALNVHVV